MDYERWMKQEVIDSDGSWTIGHIDKKAAIWDGNTKSLQEGDEFEFCSDDCEFGVNLTDEYRTSDGHWIKNL